MTSPDWLSSLLLRASSRPEPGPGKQTTPNRFSTWTNGLVLVLVQASSHSLVFLGLLASSFLMELLWPRRRTGLVSHFLRVLPERLGPGELDCSELSDGCRFTTDSVFPSELLTWKFSENNNNNNNNVTSGGAAQQPEKSSTWSCWTAGSLALLAALRCFSASLRVSIILQALPNCSYHNRSLQGPKYSPAYY